MLPTFMLKAGMGSQYYNQLCSRKTLRDAWLLIKAKHSKGGIDAITVADFDLEAEKHLDTLLAALITHTYIPMPMQKASTSKKDGSIRELGMLTIGDKIIQNAVKTIIEPVFEKKFLDVSYGYRPGKGPAKAIKRLLHIIRCEDRKWAVVCDIHNCFDSIPHAPVLHLLDDILKDNDISALIEMWLKMGKVSGNFKWSDNNLGLPQGAVLSPLLTNLYLHAFDKAIIAHNVGYVRYADDFVICCQNKETVQNMLGFARRMLLNDFQLTLNDNCRIGSPNQPFQFLGVKVNNGQVVLSKEKEEILKKRINESFGIENNKPSSNFLQILSGIKSYYGQVLMADEKNKLDAFLIDCLKERLNTAYKNRTISNKSHIRGFIDQIHFFSPQNDLIRNKIAYEITVSCKKNGNKVIDNSLIQKKVQYRKKQFRRMESSGMDLLVTSTGIQIGISKGVVTLKKSGKVIKTVKTGNLKNITITSDGIGVSSNLLKYCVEKGIAIDFLNYDGKPYAKLYTPKFAEANKEIAQIHALEGDKGIRLVKSIIGGKIKNQVNTLKYFSRQRKTASSAFMKCMPESCEKIGLCLAKLKTLECKNLEEARGKILSIEGQAATVYWNQVKLLLEKYLDFPGRKHKGAIDLVNCMLNYGYALLYSRAWEALISAKLNPYIGYLHVPAKNRPVLVYDFVEEFRSAVVDRTVIGLISKREKLMIKDGKLTDSTKKRLIKKIFERLNRIENYRDQETRFRDIMKKQAGLIDRFLCGKANKYRPYIKTW